MDKNRFSEPFDVAGEVQVARWGWQKYRSHRNMRLRFFALDHGPPEI